MGRYTQIREVDFVHFESKKTRNRIILFLVIAVICIGVGIVFLFIQAGQAGGGAALIPLAFLITSYIVFHILAGLSLTFIILSAKSKDKKKLVCIVACLGIFVVAYVFCSDHTAFVQYNLENKYQTAFIFKDKTSLNGTALYVKYHFYPEDNPDIIVEAIYDEGFRCEYSLFPSFYHKRSGDNFKNALRQYAINRILGDTVIDLNKTDNAANTIYYIQTEINNLFRKYNILVTMYSPDVELTVIRGTKTKKINFREHDINTINRLLADV